jgi:hypothetical protein
MIDFHESRLLPDVNINGHPDLLIHFEHEKSVYR